MLNRCQNTLAPIPDFSLQVIREIEDLKWGDLPMCDSVSALTVKRPNTLNHLVSQHYVPHPSGNTDIICDNELKCEFLVKVKNTWVLRIDQ